jgi:hypothetical protein
MLRLHTPLAMGVNPGGLIYHVVLFFVFFVIYSSIDFKKHFAVPSDYSDPEPENPDWVTRLYFTGVTQYAVSAPGEMVPITPFGRALIWTHITASILQALTLVAMAFASR